MKQLNDNIAIKKWQGIKNYDTKQVEGGYLYVCFLKDTVLMNVNPNVIGAKPRDYAKGSTIGFGISKASNRMNAIKAFELEYQICH